jgi:hypothetical protein
VHISGLEVEGRHPRALMGSTLPLLQQVIGLEGPAPLRLERSRPTRFRHHSTLVQSRGFFFPPMRRGDKGSSCASSAQTIRAFLFATATHAFAVPSFRCLSVIHLLRLSCFLDARNTTDREPWTRSVRRYGSPRFVVPDSRCFSPLEFCRGTRPSQAANWRPLWKVFPFEVAATTAVAGTNTFDFCDSLTERILPESIA